MGFGPPLIQDLAIVRKALFNVFWFSGPKKIWDRIQAISFKVIPKASWGSQNRGSLIQDV